jgi:type III pantothenate kinase
LVSQNISKKNLIVFTLPFYQVSLRTSMNLVIDFGNTRIKAARFNNGQMLDFKTFSNDEELKADSPFFDRVQNIIIASVTDQHLQLNGFFKGKNPLLFSSSTPVPIKNLYKSASTLGSDRLAASVGAFTLHPNQNVLTIDAGTCLKYNFVNENNEYIGGAISPGLSMRLEAMHRLTARLPLVPINFNYDKLTGTNTEESLLSGALLGAVNEVNCTVQLYSAAHKNLQVLLTGGDSEYLCKQLKNRFFAHQHLVLLGLNAILTFNIGK